MADVIANVISDLAARNFVTLAWIVGALLLLGQGLRVLKTLARAVARRPRPFILALGALAQFLFALWALGF